MEWTTDKVRSSFLYFFKERGHKIVPSASLVPKGDPTLLFTNAGMVPFKDYFLGIRTPEAPRVADCQKCLRISGKHNDLEAVGRDTYHHTFFEMLGNWSFGDYYKAEAIAWHWELITKVWGIDPKLLWATVHKDDQEAEEIWIKMGVLPRERILPFGDKDNFWEMGETGPCGPNSEIDIDRGPAACDGSPHKGLACGVNVDGCARFIELGNLVFIQYNRDAGGKLTPLPMKHVDTGTGLERVTAVLQSFEESERLRKPVVLGNYDIDVFKTIIASIQKVVVGNFKHYGEDAESDVSYRAIADHARAISFLIAEGLRPGNTDREYVLRRLIRRAIWHGHRLGIATDFLPQVCGGVVLAMGDAYSELKDRQQDITKVVGEEQYRFGSVVQAGIERIKQWVALSVPSFPGRLPGDVAFELYDTYGLPLDLTQAVCRDLDVTVDVPGFEHLMLEQRERSRSARKEQTIASELALGTGISSKFVGYDRYQAQSEILCSHVGSDGKAEVVVAETPFYPEGGGQVGDRGTIRTESGALIEISDTRKADGAIIHLGKLLQGEAGEFQRGARVALDVDRDRRDAAMLNHSATHILHYALRDILGEHVHQAGSLVAPDRLRFDFAHTGAIADPDLQTIEEEVNARIRENAPVVLEEMAYPDALKAGALAFFGEKYGDRVRVIKMGDFSVELCGGTHVSRTGDIGLFKLEAESGVAAGVRRVEALTGQGALEAVRRREEILRAIGDQLRARDGAALERLQRLLAHEKELEKKIRSLEQKLTEGGAAPADETVREIGGVKLVTRKLEGVEPGAMRAIADQMRQKYGSVVVALGSAVSDAKVALLVAVTPDLISKVKAGDIIKQIAPVVGGSGGGRPDFAQAGGRDPSRLQEALEKVAGLLGAG
ncbi:MAG: alanine--tRNA ligase [Candidatus Binataceae bacterium]